MAKKTVSKKPVVDMSAEKRMKALMNSRTLVKKIHREADKKASESSANPTEE